MRRFIIIATLGLGACEAVPDGPVGNASGDPVRINFTQEPFTFGGREGCTIGFEIQYSADAEPHRRRLSVKRADGSAAGSGPRYTEGLPVPLPADAPRVVPGPNGSEIFSQGLLKTNPCGQVTYEVTVGECLSGDCPDYLVSADDAPAVTLIRL